MSIDERWEFLRQSIESLHTNAEVLQEQISKVAEKVDKLADTVAVHEARWEKGRRVLRAALAEFLRDDEPGKENV